MEGKFILSHDSEGFGSSCLVEPIDWMQYWLQEGDHAARQTIRNGWREKNESGGASVLLV